ncbi:hypothetical protein Salat_2435600 [Sesamum alatum]|uniref:Uncharacterized protein n=1 Tax=Sesamum alatum TaxID=300844 RepID=A0AAE1XZ24_9LAMI|nr:hypothetical protein Salat_2435600 [Sesamum alatum]
MANSLGSTDGSAAKIEPGLVEATIEAPSPGRLQSSEESGGCTPGDTADAFYDSGNNGKHFPEQEDTRPGVVQEPDAYDTDLPNKPKMGEPEIEEDTAKIQEEEQVRCSEKCALKIPVIEDTAFIEGSLLGNGKFDGDGNGSERNRKREETKEKKEKKHKRRGGRARKNRDILNCTSNEKNEKRLQYSRKEMEALRFQELEDQKKKWVEVYCGFGQQVAQEYDGLVELAKIHQKHGVPSFDFDPRPQFLKLANSGDDCLKFADNQAEILNTSDPASFLPITDEIDCSGVEGECSQDDDSDEDYSSIQRPAFLVKGEPDFDSGPPQDGLEYLRRVRWEAARIPKVTVAKVNIIKEQRSYMPQVPDIMTCPEHLLPLKQWEDSFLDDFSELRLAFTRLALQGSSEESSIKLQSVHVEDVLVQMLESASFEKFDITSKDGSSSSASCILETNDANVDPHSSQKSSSISDSPALSAILKMDSAARTSTLKRRISSIEKMSTLPRNDSLWLFALCAVVDCPLDADTSAALRSLLRKCASLRAAKTEVDDEVIILNILVTISGRYFGQLEK